MKKGMIKTAEFIKMLQEEDPEGEAYVCVGNHPVRWIEKLPYYYDGRMEWVERDEHGDPVKVGWPSGVQKIKIHEDTIEDALMDNPDAEIMWDGVTYQGNVDRARFDVIKKWQQEGREFQEWRRKLQESKTNGTDPPDIVISGTPETLQGKMHSWLRAIGIIK